MPQQESGPWNDYAQPQQVEHGPWEDYAQEKNAAPATNEPIDYDKVAMSMANAKMLNIPVSSSFNNHDLINEQFAKRGIDIHSSTNTVAQDIEHGLKQTILSLNYSHKLPTPLKNPNMADKFFSGLATMVGDLPVMIPAAGISATIGSFAGPAGTVIGGEVGAFAIPDAIRETLVQGIEKGEIKDFSDLVDRTLAISGAAAKGGITGLGMYAAGLGTLPTEALGDVIGPPIAAGMRRLQQAAVISLVPAAFEKRIPTADEFAVNTALMIAMHTTVGSMEKASEVVGKTHSRLLNEYADTGIRPNAISAEALRQAQEAPAHVIDRINEITRRESPKVAKEGEIPTAKPVIPPEPRPAIKLDNGEVVVGDVRDTHNDITASEPDLAKGEQGFVDTNDEFHQTKDEATGINNASVDVQRAYRGLEPLESSKSRTREDVFGQARANVDSGNIDPIALATDIVKHPRGVSEDEVDALNYQNRILSDQYRATAATVLDAKANGDKATEAKGRERLAQIEANQGVVEEASRIVGTHSSRALLARKSMLAEDYSLSNLIQRARVASPDGEVPPALRDQLETLTAQLETANKRLEEYQANASQREAQKAVERIREGAAREGRKAARVQTRVELDEEFDGLVKNFDSLVMGRMGANPLVDPEVLGVVGKMALNRVKSGMTRIEDITDYVHGKLTDIGHDISKREVMDAISGYGKTIEMSKDEINVALREAKAQGKLLSALEDAEAGEKPLKSGLQRDEPSERVKELRKQVNEAMKASGIDVKSEMSPETQLARYKTALTNRIATMEKQLETGDFSKPEPRKPLALDPEAMDLRLKAEKTRKQIDDAMAKQKLANRSKTEKTVDFVTKWRRAGLLTGYTTLGKLTKAAMDRMGVTPVEELVGGVLSHIPGIDEVSKRAPMHGGGLNVSAEVKAVSQLWQKATAKDMWDELKTGQDSLDLLFGGKAKLPPEVLGLIGQLHGAMKVPEKRAEFFRRMEIGMQYAKDNHLDIGDPRVQSAVIAKIESRAYDEAMRAILIQDNPLTKGYSSLLNTLHSQGEAGQAIEAGLRFIFPMVRIATNLPAETLAYLPTNLFVQTIQTLRILANKDKMGRSAMDNLSMHDFDNIMRGFKKGSVGLALFGIGFGLRKNITGYYTTQQEKDRGIKRGIMNIGGMEIPAYLNDSPPFMAIQFAATIGHVWDHYNIKGMSGGLIAGSVQATQELAKRVPFYGQIARSGASSETPERSMVSSGEFAGSLMIPRLISQIAEETDPYGKKRKATTGLEAIQLQVPGLRKNVRHFRQGR